MVIHELATNASKHGALMSPAGRIDVSWGIEDRDECPRFTIQWIEMNGPPIREPERRGFGHAILFDMAEYSLEATVNLSYPASGLVWRLSAPVSAVLAIDE
jgi:two-component sensor histidine kinase